MDASASSDGAPGAADAGVKAASCPDGQFATAVAANGDLTCVTADAAAADAVRSRCAIYLGQRDSCDGCTNPPVKWSADGPVTCSPGEGAGNMCLDATLDDPAAPVQLATLDLDGDVNDDDKLYATLHCGTASREPKPAPCAPGWAIAGKSGDTWMCAPVSEAAVGYVRSQCSLYLGWQDNCDNCTTMPSKWGFAGDGGCTDGAGADNACVAATLGGETVQLFGLNTDGDVDGNDKLHLGLYCAPAAAGGSEATTDCPSGQFMIGTNADGSFQCADPAATVQAYVNGHCSLFLGWRDKCDACTIGPSKWGRVSTGSCQNGTGTDDTCTQMTLGDTSVQMFGLNTDGDVNSNDTLYIGLRCDAL